MSASMTTSSGAPRSSHPVGDTRLWLVAGLLSCAAVWWLPLQSLGLPDFAIHMIRHMTLVAIAAPCLVMGLPTLIERVPPMPLLASFAEFVIVWAWHMPGAQRLASTGGVAFLLEQGCFLLIGMLLWASVLDSQRALAGAGALLLTSMHMTLLGALIILSPRPLYLCTTAEGVDPLSTLTHTVFSPLEAQQLGGMIMLVIGTPIYLIAGLWRTHEVLADQGTESETDLRTDDDTAIGSGSPMTRTTIDTKRGLR